jgi:translation initiation factor IF-2
MPVRIYEIARKLGLESKVVLAKAKELGITTAKVPASTLDKITAEYLEQHLPHPETTAPAPVEPPKEEMAPLEALKLVTEAPSPEPAEGAGAEAPPSEVQPTETTPVEPAPAPEVQAEPAPAAVVVAPPAETVTATTPAAAPAVVEAAPAAAAPAPPQAPPPAEVAPPTTISVETPAPAPAVVEPPTAPPATPAPAAAVTAPPPPAAAPAPVVPPAPPPPPPAPPPPPKPQIGEKVGFVDLKKLGFGRTAAKPAPPARPEKEKEKEKEKPARKPEPPRAAPAARAPVVVAPANAPVITMKPPIIVRDLAEKMNRRPFQIIADLMESGVFATVNQAIDEAVATRICAKHGFRFELERRDRSKAVHPVVRKAPDVDPEDRPQDLKPRPPVVTIMGHVDHGKTTLLDVIRKSNVAAGEAGGITQHIGAYTISFPHPEDRKRIQQITFLDTPGHAAFSAMRARGANVTDIVVLVVAANDGVMPQTLEALNHAQAAKVPIIVAINKCDHPNANPLKVRQQLNDKGLVPDDWGGNTIYVECSALTGKGVDKLLEMILLQADLLDLKANPNRPASGNVIESGLEPGGPTATVLVRKGTLKVGQVILCGQYYGKVRALINEDGQRLKEAGPSHAVKVLGLNGVPEAGLAFQVVKDEKEAREAAEKVAMENRARAQEVRQVMTLENLMDKLKATNEKVLRVVVKADTQGSVEAIVEALKRIESTKVSLEIVHSAVGTISENDVVLAAAAKAVILGFHTRVDSEAAEAAKREGVQIKLYAIIYELIDQVRDAMAGLLEPIIKETVIGAAEVRKVFTLSKGGNVAGCMVMHGRVARGKARVVRRRNVIYEGIISSLRRFQDEVNEVRAGMECGIRLDGFNDFQENDTIECYILEKVAQKLE